jgi:uncharacterized protein (TIGR03118 family)
LAIAPASFKGFAGDLLVGNFGDGMINVFSADPTHAGAVGQLDGVDGKPIVIDGLWGLMAGNDGSGGSSEKIYFSAGPNDESHGLFGVLHPAPEPSSIVLGMIGAGVVAGRCAWNNRRRREAARID